MQIKKSNAISIANEVIQKLNDNEITPSHAINTLRTLCYYVCKLPGSGSVAMQVRDIYQSIK